MKLIDRYVREIGDMLPENRKQDIEKEIRSLIEDRLADRCEELGVDQPTEEMVKDVLAEMGPPEEVAKGYLPDVYLIGPRYFFIFSKVMKIVLVAQAIALTVVFVIQLVMEGASSGLSSDTTVSTFAVTFQEIIQTGLSTIGMFIQASLTAFAVVVLIFAAIEWKQRKDKIDLNLWNPLSLNEPQPEKVSRVGKVFELIFILIGLTVFNLYPEWVSLWMASDGGWIQTPVLTDNFWRFLPLINISWMMSFCLGFYLVLKGSWERWTYWMEIGIKLFEMVIIFFLISSAPLVGVSPDAWAASGFPTEFSSFMQNNIFTIVNISIQVALGIALVASGVEVIKRIFKRTRPVLES